MAKNVITLLHQRNFKPSVKLPSWNDAYYCEYHRCKGHRTNNFQALKNAIQYLIDKDIVTIEGNQQ